MQLLIHKIFLLYRGSQFDWWSKYLFLLSVIWDFTYLTNRIFLSCLGWSRRDSSASCLAFSSNLFISSVCPVSEKKNTHEFAKKSSYSKQKNLFINKFNTIRSKDIAAL